MYELGWFINMMKQGYSPEQVMMNVLQTQMAGTPMGDNLIQLAQTGNTAEIEKIARNITAQRGMDFDKEFSAFRKRFGL